MVSNESFYRNDHLIIGNQSQRVYGMYIENRNGREVACSCVSTLRFECRADAKANEEMAKVVIEKPNLDMDPMFGPHRMENGKLPQQQGQMPPEIPGGQQMGVGGYQPQMGGGGEYLQGGGGGQGYPNEMNEFFQVKSMKNFEKLIVAFM